MRNADVSVDVRDLTKFYGDVRAVDALTFSVKRGEVVGFLGPNGAGKTTTAKILTCFMSANSGEARIAGFDVYKEAHQVRKRVGYLPEHNPLYADMVVHDYLKFVAEVRGVARGKRRARIAEMASLCGLKDVMHREIKQLSKGYRQRVGLAQAMIHEPEVLILDEPTSGLDPNQILEIRDLIKQIGQQKTVMLSTHILQEVTAVCDRILVINGGQLVGNGTLDTLRKQIGRPDASLETVFRVLTGGRTEESDLEKPRKTKASRAAVAPAPAPEPDPEPDAAPDADATDLAGEEDRT